MSDLPISRKSLRTSGNRKRRLRIALTSVASVLAVSVAAAGVFAFNIAQSFNSAEKIVDAFPDDALRPEPWTGEGSAPKNILLLGSDTREPITGSLASAAGNRSDTMMVVHVPADRGTIQVMSLMRDSWVEIPGHGNAKLNAALAFGGVPLAVQTVEGVIGARIDHVAIVDFAGFKGVTDALGGVSLDNPIAFSPRKLAGHRFEQGPITLDGEQALAFVRERYAFVDGDYQRVRNQQLFLRAMMGQVLTSETLTNPVKISNLVGAMTPFIAVDDGFDAGHAAGLGFELRDVRIKNVRMFTLPTLGVGREGSQSVVRVDWDEVAKVRQAFAADTVAAYEPPAKT